MADSSDFGQPALPTGDALLRLVTAACGGKTFEHHERTVPIGHPASSQWRCPACGDTGCFGDFARWLMQAIVIPLGQLQKQALSDGAVILVPSDATPGRLGQFYGHQIYRVQGIERPMVAIPGT